MTTRTFRILAGGRTAPHVDAKLAMAALVFLAIVPLLAVQLPPLVDLFGHIGRYAIQTELSQRPEIQPFFSYEWKLLGNLGADLLVQLLHPLFGLEGAVRIIVIGTQMLAAIGIMAVSREVHGRITPFAIAALPLIYSFPFNFGFLNFVLSMALALNTLAFWLHLRRRGNDAAASILLIISGLTIWLCHAYGWAFLCLLVGSIALAEAIRRKLSPLELVRHGFGLCWPLLLPLIPMMIWRAAAESAGSETGEWSIPLKVMWTVSILRTWSATIDIASLILLAGFGYIAARSRSGSMDLGIGLAALFCVATFAILPARVFGSYFADMRMAPYAMMLGLLAISPKDFAKDALRWLTVAAVAFFIGRMTATTYAYIRQDQRVAEAMPTLGGIPEGSRVATFIVNRCGLDWPLPVLWHVGGLSVARYNLFANDQWEQSGMNPLSVHLPEAGRYAHDASQVIYPDDCVGKENRSLSFVLDDLPREAFTHIWVLGLLPDTEPVVPGLEPVGHRGAGWLFAIRPDEDPS